MYSRRSKLKVKRLDIRYKGRRALSKSQNIFQVVLDQ